jgi:hypothetical protein
VVSRASLAAEWPMRELHILLQRHRDSAVKLVPLLHFDDFREFERCVEEYECCRCSSGGCRCHKRLWAEDLRRLQAVTMVRKDKVSLPWHSRCPCGTLTPDVPCSNATRTLCERSWPVWWGTCARWAACGTPGSAP